MAKRKRLTPAQETYLAHEGPAPEVKSYLRPALSGSATPPIAQIAGDASTTAALQELSEMMTTARTEGRLVQRFPLWQVNTSYLVRDRMGTDEAELQSLMDSLQAHGQRTPIEVVEVTPNRYGLISGWRRLAALSRLFDATSDGRFSSVLAFVRTPKTAEDAYVAMVEENEIRLGLSYYERARVAAKAVEQGVFPTEKAALQKLFAAASRARRSKIGAFLAIYHAFDAVLQFPAALSERTGLAFSQMIGAEPDRMQALARDFAARPARTMEEELGRITHALQGKQVLQKKTETAVTEPVVTSAMPVTDPTVEVTEPQPGVFLRVEGGFLHPVLTISGPAVGPDMRERLASWLASGR